MPITSKLITSLHGVHSRVKHHVWNITSRLRTVLHPTHEMELVSRHWVEKLSANKLVAHYLINSYLYYQLNRSVMTDDAYDYCCQRLDAEWDLIDHPHKGAIDRQSLSATTGYTLKHKDYPTMVRFSADIYLESVLNGTLYNELFPQQLSLL